MSHSSPSANDDENMQNVDDSSKDNVAAASHINNINNINNNDCRGNTAVCLSSQNLEQIPNCIVPPPSIITSLSATTRTTTSHIISLDLSRNKISEIPPSIGFLSSLQTLDLSRNRILVLPDEIGNLQSLVTLNLLSNKLRPVARSIPTTISNCKRLKVLDLRFNPKIKPSAVANTLKVYFESRSMGDVEIRITDPSSSSSSSSSLGNSNNTEGRLDDGKGEEEEHGKHACDRDATLLRSQLEPLSTPTLRRRLEETFGETVALDNYGSRSYIMKRLLQAYESTPGALPRTILHYEGRPISTDIANALLTELQDCWTPSNIRERPKIRADRYMILRSPLEFISSKGNSAKAKLAAAKLQRHQHLWDLATKALREVDAVYADVFTALAVTHNFQGSPHIDTQNIGPFYGLSLGNYHHHHHDDDNNNNNNNTNDDDDDDKNNKNGNKYTCCGGGRLCVEVDARHVAYVDTKNKLAKVDGRFVHWVDPTYTGDRYSLIYYQTIGDVTPQTTAVLPLP